VKGELGPTGRGEGRRKDQSRSFEKEGGVQVQLQAETSAILGRRPGNEESSPVPVRKQIIP